VTTLGLAAIQLQLTLDDLASPRAYRAAVDRAADEAAAAIAGADERLLVYPEACGHLAVLAIAPAAARRRATLAGAISVLAARRPLAVAAGMVAARAPSLRVGALVAILPEAEALVREAFSEVARRHRAFVVAGSHLRAGPRGQLTNTSFTFDPRGELVATTDKVNLVPGLEDDAPGGLGLRRGRQDDLPVLQTGFGNLATLICYDGFCVPHTRGEPFSLAAAGVDEAGADVVANPAANPWPWNEGWELAAAGDGRLRREQWAQEGLPTTLGRLRRVRYGVTAHLVSSVLDLRFEGPSQILERTAVGVDVVAEAESWDRGEIVAARVPAPRRVEEVLL
jgi:predicted amidohydrolase